MECLIHKLKSTVDSTDLPFFEPLKLLVTKSYSVGDRLIVAIVDSVNGTYPIFHSNNGNTYPQNHGVGTSIVNVDKIFTNTVGGYFDVVVETLYGLSVNNLKFDKGITLQDVISVSSELQELKLSNNIYHVNLSDISNNLKIKWISTEKSDAAGTIEEFAQSQLDKGRYSGEVKIYGNGIITYDGQVISEGSYKTVSYSQNSYRVS